MKKMIPSSGELVPVIGLGTWRTFDVGEDKIARAQLLQVLQAMVEKEGSIIDSSPMYGTSEKVVGDLTQQCQSPSHFFYATKVWTRGREAGIIQMNESFRLMQRKTMDLIQIHNLMDWETHIKTLRDWKDRGKLRYIGLTHYLSNAHDEVMRIMKDEPVDFVQINYSITDRNADQQLFNVAEENGVAILVNRPYNQGSLFRNVKGKPLPIWAVEYDIKTWGQYFLKFIISHPAVTVVIPGTSKVSHALDNLQAGYGKMPDEKGRIKMRNHFEQL